MPTKHTQGPQYAALVNKLANDYTRDIIKNPDGKIFDHIQTMVDGNPLIAAAPELLEACKEAMKALQYWGNQAHSYAAANDPVRLDAHLKLMDAVQKAEGR
jgi:hypothetical protein